MLSVSAHLPRLHRPPLSTLEKQHIEASCSWDFSQRVLLPFSKCRCMLLQVYKDAAAAYRAIDQRLRAKRDGDFIFGSRPSSLDALLFSHLAFHQGAPVSAPELRQAVITQPLLLTKGLAGFSVLTRLEWLTKLKLL